MKKDIIKQINDYHIRICIAILMLISLFMFCSGFIPGGTTQYIPWWFALLYGWSGLVVAYKLGKFWYKD